MPRQSAVNRKWRHWHTGLYRAALGQPVSGDSQNGILIDADSQSNVLNGNFVGTTADGNSALGNAADGVPIAGADNNSLIGCTRVEKPFVYYNVVSGNGDNGLEVKSSNNVTVQASFFGVAANNTNLIANHGDGVLIGGTAHDNTIGVAATSPPVINDSWK